MSTFSVKAEELTPEIVRIGNLLHNSHEILNELPFRIWIQKYNRENDDKICLTVEYSKDKTEELSQSESVHTENIFTVSIDRDKPMFTINDELVISPSDIDKLTNWIKENYNPIMKLWGKETVLIHHYPVRIEWFYD